MLSSWGGSTFPPLVAHRKGAKGLCRSGAGFCGLGALLDSHWQKSHAAVKLPVASLTLWAL